MRKFYIVILLILGFQWAAAQGSYFYSNTIHHFETILNGSQQWRYFVGNSEPDSNWRKTTFSDASWSTGNGGIGYGDNDDATVLTACSSVYMRKSFVVSDTSTITELLLSIDYDDGFVAYINNVEVARKNVGTPGVIPNYNTPAIAPHEARLYQSLNAEYFFIAKSVMKAMVKNGVNILCIQVHNYATSGTDNDLSALPYLMAGMNASGTNYSQNPTWFKPPFHSHLPIIQIVANNVAIVNEPKKTMIMRIIDNGNDQNHLPDSANDYYGKAGIELHGASSLNFAQKSYGITTYDSLSQPDNVKILGFPKESDYILYAPYNDKTLMRNAMMYDLARKMGWWAPRCRYVEAFLDTVYIGVYVMMEKVKIDKNRVPVTQIKPNHNAGDSLTGGYIFKVDWNADAGLGTWNSHITSFNSVTKSIRFQTSDPNGTDITQAQRDYVEYFIDSFEQNLLSTGMNNINTGYRKYIDVGSFIDFFILNEITHNVDAYRASTYFFKSRNSEGGKLVMGPIWDFNYSLGNASFCNTNDTNGWCGCTANNTMWWFDQLNTENYYRDQLRCRWTSLYYSVLAPYNINNYIDSVAAYLFVPQLRHFTKWPILGTDLNNGHVSSVYSQETNHMKNWYRGRTTWLNLYMPGWHNPCFESVYSNRLYITEVNYNSDKNFDAGNWIELYNNSSGNINLNNFMITANGGANSKKFGSINIPGFSYIVLCEDTNKFKLLYPDVKNRVGNLGFSLNNLGGKITLYDITSYPVFNFVYSADAPWPQGANGGGKTLEHYGVNGNYNSPYNWFDGCLWGSPGRAYGRCIQDVNITEINYTAAASHNTGDWFEIKNNSNSPKNIGGYIFKDDDNLHLFTFPTNFTIPANDYYIVCADTAKFKSFHPTIKNRIGNFNFGISNKSDAIRLYTNTNLLYQNIYYTDTAAPWPNGANGTGYTIELRNDTIQCDLGSNWTIGCLYGSPGQRYHKACNPGLTAKVSVSELNTKPPAYNDDGGWIELHNYDTLDLDLTDFQLSHNSSSDTAYKIKEGTIIRKNGYLILCNDTAKFKKKHPGLNSFYALNKWKFNASTDSLIFKDFNGNVFIRMSYLLNAGMGSEAFGLGKTRELKSDTSNANFSTNYFDGCFEGSPGLPYSKCDRAPLMISEINYKSSSAFDQGFWLELKNVDTVSINLNHYYFRKSGDTTKYTFPKNTSLLPGQYLGISYDSLRFVAANPFISGMRFASAPTFSNKNEIIQIFDTAVQWLNVQYLDTLPFPIRAAGNGYTLESINDSVNPFYASSFATRCYGGSPGSAASLPCTPAITSNLTISEINYRSEAHSNSGLWIELHNRSAIPQDISGWYLTASDLKKNSIFPSNTIIAGNEYLVLVSDSVKFKNQYPSVSKYLSIPNNLFNALHDSIKIYDPRGFQACKAFFSNDTNWVQEANGGGYTLEKTDTSKNSINATAWNIGCLNGSPGAPFTPCSKSPLIISEINFNPGTIANSGTWLELKNTGTTTINLSNYVFYFNQNDSLKINASIGAGSYLVLASDSNRFRAQHPFISNVRSSNFKLDTIANTIAIYQNKILKSTVRYNPYLAGLETANGQGYTLELIHDSLLQIDPKIWTTGCFKGSPGTQRLTPCSPALNANITFSEINYQSDTLSNSGVWVEFHNSQNQVLNLKNWVALNAAGEYWVIDNLSIPANSYWVWATDTAKFHSVYPGVVNYSYLPINLSKTSDSIILLDYSGTLACKAFYSSDDTWPWTTHGRGKTLESNGIRTQQISLNHWQAGCFLGSPGAAFVPCTDPVIISEINYAPQLSANDGKWLELYFNSNISSSISKITLRSGDTLQSITLSKPPVPNSYLVLCSDTVAFNKYHSYIDNKLQFPNLNLSVGVHEITVYDDQNHVLQVGKYSSFKPWDSLANGIGYTLELIKDSIQYHLANNYKSYCKRGSAGAATYAPCGNAFGINAKPKLSLPSIYPNPANKKLTLEVPQITTESLSFYVYDLPGKTLLKGNISEHFTVLDISTLAAGVYMIQIGNYPPMKFVKE